MPSCANPYINQQVAALGSVDAGSRHLPWRPVTHHITLRDPAAIPADVEKHRKEKREKLAASAQVRYSEWRSKQPPPEPPHTSAHIISHHFPRFRERNKTAELHGEWANPNRMLSKHERIDHAVTTSSAAFLQNPPYPKQGGGVKNVEFSYMASGYDYRAREPSKEVSGTWPFMRTRPLTESARINESVEQQRLNDNLGGSRWAIDQRYGHPTTFSPTTTGDDFRQASPGRWLASPTHVASHLSESHVVSHVVGANGSHGRRSPPQTAGSVGLGQRQRKWRGSFATDFPPRTKTAEPLDGSSQWMHHTVPFQDRFHDSVAVHIPESIGQHRPTPASPAFRPTRQRGMEMTGAHIAGQTAQSQFWPQYTGAEFLPNPSPSATWNLEAPRSPMPHRGYPKTGRDAVNSPHPADGDDGLLSASQVEPSSITQSG